MDANGPIDNPTCDSVEGSESTQRSIALNADKAGHGTDKTRTGLLHEDITRSAIAGFYAVYDKLGFGFLENVYRGALTIELRRRGHQVRREIAVPVFYEEVRVALYKMDFIVDDVVVLELKSTHVLNPSDRRQLLNYLRATRYEVGLLLHFGPKPKFYRLVASEYLRRR
jgi:GxxExxY protein